MLEITLQTSLFVYPLVCSFKVVYSVALNLAIPLVSLSEILFTTSCQKDFRDFNSMVVIYVLFVPPLKKSRKRWFFGVFSGCFWMSPPAPRWLMTSEELSTYEAESYPPPCVDPSFFEGPYGPRHGWAMIPQSLYKTEKNDVLQLMWLIIWCKICACLTQKTTKKLVVFYRFGRFRRCWWFMIILSLQLLRHLTSWWSFSSCLTL